MMPTRWQKARLLTPAHAAGYEVWVKCEAPHRVVLRHGKTRRRLGSYLVYDTNVTTVNHKRPLFGIAAEHVELLPEFSEDVELISEEEHDRRARDFINAQGAVPT